MLSFPYMNTYVKVVEIDAVLFVYNYKHFPPKVLIHHCMEKGNHSIQSVIV